MSERKTPERVARGLIMKDRRKRLGMSMDYVYLASGVHDQALRRLERGLVGGQLEVLLRLAECYGCTVSELIGEKDD